MTAQNTWDHLTDFALQLATAAGEAILPHFRKNAPIDVKQHEHWDPVTEGDRAGERAMRTLIEKHYPEHGIIGEEYGSKEGTSGLTWILDPVDGTRAFVIGLPTWTTLIGLYEDGEPRLGVMCQPFVGDMFYGNPTGAWLNHRGSTEPIRARAPVGLSNAALGTTTPHLYKGKDRAGFENLRESVKVTRYGMKTAERPTASSCSAMGIMNFTAKSWKNSWSRKPILCVGDLPKKASRGPQSAAIISEAASMLQGI